MRQAEKEKKKIKFPNSVHTRPGQENSEKIEEEMKKFKNHFPALFLAKTGLDRLRKRKKKVQSRIPFILDPGKKIQKKIAKKFKK